MNQILLSSLYIDEIHQTAAPDCIICAAGASRRMGEWKLSLPWFSPGRSDYSSSVCSEVAKLPVPLGGRSQESWLIDAAVASALSAGCRVILVTGFRCDELEDHFSCWPDVRVVRNEQWDQGMVSSIKAGLPHVQSPWFFIAHADMPLIESSWYRRLLATVPEGTSSDDPIAVRPLFSPSDTRSAVPFSDSAFAPQPGHPVLFSHSAVSLIKAAPEGDSLKPVLHQCQVLTVDTNDQTVIYDVDSLEAYIIAVSSCGEKSRQQVIQHGAAAPDAARGASSVRLITGKPGSGKTTQLRQRAFRSFINLMGSPHCTASLFVMVSQVQTGRKHDGKALGFDLEAFYWTKKTGPSFFREALCRSAELLDPVDLSTMVNGEPSQDREFQVMDPITLGPYQFDPSAFENLARWLAPVLDNHTSYQSIYVYIDELGKLELDERRGLWITFTRLLEYAVHINATGGNYNLVFSVRKDRQEKLASYLENCNIV